MALNSLPFWLHTHLEELKQKKYLLPKLRVPSPTEAQTFSLYLFLLAPPHARRWRLLPSTHHLGSSLIWSTTLSSLDRNNHDDSSLELEAKRTEMGNQPKCNRPRAMRIEERCGVCASKMCKTKKWDRETHKFGYFCKFLFLRSVTGAKIGVDLSGPTRYSNFYNNQSN